MTPLAEKLLAEIGFPDPAPLSRPWNQWEDDPHADEDDMDDPYGELEFMLENLREECHKDSTLALIDDAMSAIAQEDVPSIDAFLVALSNMQFSGTAHAIVSEILAKYPPEGK